MAAIAPPNNKGRKLLDFAAGAGAEVEGLVDGFAVAPSDFIAGASCAVFLVSVLGTDDFTSTGLSVFASSVVSAFFSELPSAGAAFEAFAEDALDFTDFDAAVLEVFGAFVGFSSGCFFTTASSTDAFTCFDPALVEGFEAVFAGDSAEASVGFFELANVRTFRISNKIQRQGRYTRLARAYPTLKRA
ncbi:hypothetical protein O2N63_02365 [Aliiroseovarius sp. KMU-50]|uniref:Uncharacterized protein n=1 Tax=Aliiroseovarius salicola TaxID=3009082 RepID=A0ABT4VXD9_9RHOB|nr:hypothetical protein [Aliiroseovarius sp. KMU-50]MDA5092918.1 hypothetical protein [Aliiroseovarius sp. KMU-50]